MNSAWNWEPFWQPYRLTSLWEIMQKFDAGKLMEAVLGLSNLGQRMDEGQSVSLTLKTYEHVMGYVDRVCADAERLELLGCLATARKLKSIVDDECSRGSEKILGEEVINFLPGVALRLKTWCKEIHSRACDELSAKSVMMIPSNSARYLEQAEPLFGPEVETTFQAANEDISEAGKCYALGRSTASVFHLMRAMELAVSKLGKKLNITIVDKDNVSLEWGKILANMKVKAEAMPRGEARDTWSESLTLLYHVNKAWRHSTMHPKQTYTEEQAKEVLDATRAFMRHLATLI